MTEDAITRWVRRVNESGRKLDEAAASIHPSTWPETLAVDREAWKRLARRKS